MAAAGAGFRFDDDNSDDDFSGDRMGSPGAAAKDEDGMQVDGMRVDWGDGFDDSAASVHAPLDAMEAGSRGIPSQVLTSDGAHQEDWCTRAESALVAKASRDALAALAVSPGAESAPELRDKLLQRVADADSYGTRALAALRDRQPIANMEALLAEGLELGVETRELVRVQQCVRQALEVQNRLAAFDYCEEQMELRGLKSILNEMERLPVVLPEEQTVRERWSQSNAWLDRARAILNPPRTRQGKQGKQSQGACQQFALQDVESLVQEGRALPLVCDRAEARDLELFLKNFAAWREEARAAISAAGEHAAAQQQSAPECPAEGHEEALKALVERGAAFSVKCDESTQLDVLLWTCRAEAATRGKTSLKDLTELCDAAATTALPASLLQGVQEKKHKAEEWVKAAQVLSFMVVHTVVAMIVMVGVCLGLRRGR